MRKFFTFLRMPRYKKLLFIKCCYLFLLFQIKIRCCALKNIIAGIDRKYPTASLNALEKQEYNHHHIKNVRWTIRKVESYLPWMKCLVKALVGKTLLAQYNIPSTIYFGVKKDKVKDLAFHAWLKCADVVITGGDGREFSELQRYEGNEWKKANS